MSKEELLNRRRLTMLSGSEERLITQELDDEEIVEGLINKLFVESFKDINNFSDDGVRTSLSRTRRVHRL